jgi:hypothetical protein
MLKALAENVWILNQPLRLLGFLPLGARMTVVRLADGGLWLHSPVKLGDAEREEVAALGPVRYVIAPNRFHHLFVAQARAAFPQARFLAARGLAKKRKDFAFDGQLGNDPEPGYAADLSQHIIGGMPVLNETVFLHRSSRTLIASDLLFNAGAPKSLWAKAYLKLMGTYGGPAQSRMVKLAVLDKVAAYHTVRRVLEWDFDRVVMAHGKVIESGGKEALRQATQWLATAVGPPRS